MRRKDILRRAAHGFTHSLELSDATDLFYLFSKCNKTRMSLVQQRTLWEERPRDESVSMRITFWEPEKEVALRRNKKWLNLWETGNTGHIKVQPSVDLMESHSPLRTRLPSSCSKIPPFSPRWLGSSPCTPRSLSIFPPSYLAMQLIVWHLLFFIVVKYIWYKTCHFNHFKIYNLVALKTQ